MRSTLFNRAKDRRIPPTTTSQARTKDNLTPASMDEHDIYFDKTPRANSAQPVTQTTLSMDDEGSRPPPRNPDAVSLASSSIGLPRSNSNGRTSPSLLRRASMTTSAVPPKINVSTFWAAADEFERKYDLTPVDNGHANGAGSNHFSVDPWEQDGSKRGQSTGR